MTTYHDLYITTAEMVRTSIFDLPFDMMVTCTRVGGWELWQDRVLIAGEYHDDGMRLDVAGHVIVDSLHRPTARR